MPRPLPDPRHRGPLVAAVLPLTLTLTLTLAACGGGSGPPLPARAANLLEGALDIVAWPGYVERGASDRRYDWVTPFEKDTGCKVNVRTAGTSDEMVSLMAQGGYDLVTASGDASLRLVRAGTVQALNMARIPGYRTLDERLKEAPWHFVDGKHFGVPYQWGPNVLMYNTRMFRQAPTSWSVVFEAGKLADGKPVRGHVQAYDGPIYIADAALYLMAHNPALGIKDPYELDEQQYAATLELLRQQHPLVQRYWHDASVQVQDFTTGDAAVSGSWPFQVNALRAKKRPIASTIPIEGATGWADTTMLYARARHPNCAYKWLEWSLSPKLQGDVAARFGSLPTVPAACANNALLGPEGCKINGVALFDKIHFWRTPEAVCRTQTSCVPYSRWSIDYRSIIAGR